MRFWKEDGESPTDDVVAKSRRCDVAAGSFDGLHNGVDVEVRVQEGLVFVLRVSNRAVILYRGYQKHSRDR